jgi:thiamine biosynthesis lipoprotein
MSAPASTSERSLVFPSCGGRAAVIAQGGHDPDRSVAHVRHMLESWERRLTRFDPRSELSMLNARRATRLRVSDLMCSFVAAAVDAAARTNGLVDPTLLGDVEAAGYRAGPPRPLPLPIIMRLAPPRRPAQPHPLARWSHIEVDRGLRLVERPRGVELDSGGIAKGLFADLAAESLAGFESFAVDCCGDLRIGGRSGRPRRVRVDDPFGRGTLHELRIADGAIATSGISARSWIGPDGRAAHHLIDPSTGRPAFTGIVQATAVAPTAVEAEALAKAALLEGPARAERWLPHGGVLVFDDGSHAVVAGSREQAIAA